MIENLTEKELTFLETFNYSPALAECLFSHIDNLTIMEDGKNIEIRPYQLPLLSQEYLLSNNPALSEKQNFLLRKNSGDCYALGGRLFGKTKILLQIDLLLSMVLLGSEKVGFTSYDAIHIRGVLEDIVQVLENHPFFRLFQPQITRQPNYRFYLRTGYLLESVNQNLMGKSPGKAFFQKHFTRLYGDEVSVETEEIFQKRRDAISEFGCIYRFAGMTDFTQQSIIGQIFYAHENKRRIVNLPQKVSPLWDERKREQAIKDFGGESSAGYRIFINGEVVEDGISVFDMQRIHFDEDRELKIFEVNKLNFPNFQNFLNVVKPPSAKECYICADIGEAAPTEIVVLFKIGEAYRFEYNITAFNLTDKEQFKLFRWLAETLSANYIGIDTTDGTGRSIYRSLLEVFKEENLGWCAFNEKTEIGYEKDQNSHIIFKDGKPTFKEEYVSEWSIKRLKDLFYANKVNMPVFYKLHKQLNNIIARQSVTGRTIYESKISDDHLFQAFQVFAITEWKNEFRNSSAIKRDFFMGGV